MLTTFRAKKTNVFVWILLVALIIGLAGFGIGAGSGLTRTDVANVGEQDISTQDYARALDQELRGLAQQTGRNITIDEARAFGIDRRVLARLINDAALDDTAQNLGISTGDAVVRQELLTQEAFQGVNGFDRETYTFVLERIGLSTAEFEDTLRRDVTRSMMLAALGSPVRMPEIAAQTILDYAAEERGFSWIELGEAQLEAPISAPTDEELAAYHTDHTERYTRPETRQITYAIADVDRIARDLDFDDAALRAAYDENIDRFTSPERRLIQRITFPTMEDAGAAFERLEKDEVTFEDVVAERGLTQDATDLRAAERDSLSRAVGDLVFEAPEPGLYGPVESDLGPAIYRINAIIDAQVVSFEDARETLRGEQAHEEAERMIFEEVAPLEDLIAGGARLEEIAEGTLMEIETIALNADSTEPIAQDAEFLAAARDAREGEETDLIKLANGGYTSLRLESIDAPHVIPLAEIRDRVTADWRADQVAAKLVERAGDLKDRLANGETLAAIAEELALDVTTSEPQMRGNQSSGLPPLLIADLFTLDKGAAAVSETPQGAVVAIVDDIVAFDVDAEDNAELLNGVTAQLSEQTASDVLAMLTAALRNEAGLRIHQGQIDNTLARFQ